MKDLKTEIRALEKSSRRLEPEADQREVLRNKVIAYSEKFLREIDDHPTFLLDHNGGVGLLEAPIGEEGEEMDKLLQLMAEEVDKPGLNPASGGHLGYIPGGGLYVSALGDYLADVSNRYAGVYYGGPGAVRMENMLIRWMAGIIGFPEDAAGNLASGGSIANLIAIVTARDTKKINSANIQSSVIYASPHQHHCLDKAIRIAGLSECILRKVPVDDQRRMDAEALETMLKKDIEDGLYPWLVIASAGTTDTGSVDPLDAIGTIAEEYKLWYHVDAAYGGFFILSDLVKAKLLGMHHADSVVMDPHKGLFLPYGLGVVLVKNVEALKKSHSFEANYMQDAVDAVDEISPSEVSPELTKHFRGLRMWLPLKLHGVEPFRACLEEKLLLARYFEQEVAAIEGFETGGEPELSVVTFRYVPQTGDANAFNKQLIDYVNREGTNFLSSTLIDEQYTIRLACLSFRTRLDRIDHLIQTLKAGVAHITAGN